MINSDFMLGKCVIVRDHMAGVFIGTLSQIDLQKKSWVLLNARKIHYWSKAAAVEGLAVVGDNGEGGRITPMVEWVAGCDLVQVLPVTGGEKLLNAPVWEP